MLSGFGLLVCWEFRHVTLVGRGLTWSEHIQQHHLCAPVFPLVITLQVLIFGSMNVVNQVVKSHFQAGGNYKGHP